MTIDRLRAALADRYRLERELGAGGMATVSLAEDLKHKRKVAIKVMRPELAAVIGAERFLAEITTTANLQHPHILPLHDSGAVDGTVFYVMPFIEGESLRDRLDREKQLSIGDAVRITREVAGALDYAHRHGVIHRDIKPENILLHDGRALVADFGIALAASKAEGSTRMTETGMSLGTPHYMSPEQAMGERTLDARTDVYALGCVLYEMLTGEPPFTGPSAQAIVAKVMTERPTAPSATRDTLPAALEDAVFTALAKLPVDRFATAAAFADSLAGTEEGRPRERGRTVAATRPDRRRLMALAMLAAVLAVVAGIGWLRPTSADVSAARPLAYQIHLSAGEDEVGFVAAQVALSADGSTIVFSDTAKGTRQLWIKERGEADARPIPGTLGGWAPFLSPDGRMVAYINGTQLLRIPITGGTARVLSDSALVDERPVRGAWLDDGTIVFLGGGDSFIFAVPDTGGVTRRIATVDQLLGFVIAIAAVPAQRAVVVSACDRGSCAAPVIHVVRLDPFAITRILPGTSGAWPLIGDRLLSVLPDGSAFIAPFDPAKGEVGEGAPLFEGVTVASRGPELSVGIQGVVLQASGGAGGFTSNSELMEVHFDGTVRQVDPSWQVPFANNSRVDLSPDGRRVLISLVDQDGVQVSLYTKPFPTGPATLFSNLGFQGARAVWSPDGQRIAWVVVEESGLARIFGQSADGAGAPTLLAEEPRGLYEVGFSPDGEWLLYRTDDVASGLGDIYGRRLRGDTAVITIAASAAEETSPAVSPDGRWVAYSVRIGAIKELVVRPFPNVEGGRVQLSSGGGREPLWSRDGRTLYYRDALGNRVLAAVMAADGTFPASGRSVVFENSATREYWDNDDSRHYSLLPDGKGFLMMRRVRRTAESAATRLILREQVGETR